MKCLTIGSAMLDTIAIIDSECIERMSMTNADTAFLLLEEGRKTDALGVSTHCGGGGVNTAVCMARLGADVRCLVRVGRDPRGTDVLNRLDSEGISTQWVVQDEAAPTGSSVMVSSHERNAAIFTHRGANCRLSEDELNDDAFAVDLVYVSCLSGESAACFDAIAAKAKANGAMVAVNPGMRQLSAHTEEVISTLAHVDVLSINRAEAEVLAPFVRDDFGDGAPAFAPDPDDAPFGAAVSGIACGAPRISIASFCSALLRLGPSVVLLTDGENGAYAAVDGELVHCPILPAEVKGTAGAGDAFAATFACHYLQERDVRRALQAASVNASSVVGHVDTQTGLLSKECLEERIAAQADELRVRAARRRTIAPSDPDTAEPAPPLAACAGLAF